MVATPMDPLTFLKEILYVSFPIDSITLTALPRFNLNEKFPEFSL
jgi:hypothetical protein